MSKLIVICGLPGSGKTTLAKELSKKLNIVNINKDSIKEGLYEIEELSTLEHSKEVGLRAFRLEVHLAEEQVANEVDLMMESPFRHEQDQAMLREWEQKYNLELYSIICQISESERVHRFRSRPRHKAHHDHERTVEDDLDAASFYKNMPGKQIWITTDKPVEQLLEQIFTEFKF